MTHQTEEITIKRPEFLLWLSRLRTRCCLCEDVGLIPDPTQWVKDPVLPQAEAQAADIAQIWCCHGCGRGLNCSSNLTPSLGTSICCRCGCK